MYSSSLHVDLYTFNILAILPSFIHIKFSSVALILYVDQYFKFIKLFQLESSNTIIHVCFSQSVIFVGDNILELVG
ncbi:hypothetical protein HOF65_03645 [bacterium]|nr:hypothetical protein [bacterium]MBT3853072.1 hypothetical protein [bacterium]MBT4633331.1 hypothetical protein [bacterium]MBT6779253.1 hypothetical protein [bacterium]